MAQVIASCYDNGRLNRTPENKEQNSIDDYLFTAMTCKLIGTTKFMKLIVDYGWDHGWVYANDDCKNLEKAWLGRFPALIGSMKIVAGYRPSILETTWTFFSLIFSNKEQDSLALNWAIKIIWKGRNRFIDFALEVYTKRFKKAYPGGMGELLKAYYDNDIWHPDYRFLENDFGDTINE